MAIQKTTIVLDPEQVTVTTLSDTGVKTVKQSNIETIQQIFMKEQALQTPLLPSQWGVVKYYRKNHYEGYVLTTAPTEREVTFDINNSQVIPESTILPVPPLLWIFEVMTDQDGNKKLTHSMVYVLKHELLSFKDKIMHAPFCNIGVSHGICWGNRYPEVPVSKSIQNIPARFFSQPFNSDLSGNRVKEFTFDNPSGDDFTTDSALYHMVREANRLAAAKEAGETYVYPFDSLKPITAMDVETAVKTYLPSIFK